MKSDSKNVIVSKVAVANLLDSFPTQLSPESAAHMEHANSICTAAW